MLSRYNIYKKINSNIVIFNTFSGSIIDLSKDEFKKIKKDLKNGIESNEVKTLTDLGMIVEKDNELDIIKYNYKCFQFDDQLLSITICPTMDCNFKCPYCFESREKGLMSREDEDILYDFIKDKITKNTKTLDILWFGGEPLLGADIIDRLSQRLISLAQENNLKYRAYIISNGYLITDKILEMFIKNRITGIQITIDGPKEIHDTRRIPQPGIGTYDRIKENVKKLINNGIEVTIRVNIDKSNCNLIEKLFDDYEKSGIKNVQFAFGHVIDYTENCRAIACTCLSKKQFSNVSQDLDALLEKHGFKRSDVVPEYTPIYCDATRVNAFNIDHKLNVYKCLNELGNTSLSTFNIKENKRSELQYENERKYINYDPMDKKCKKCIYLPVCNGGCPYMNLKTKRHNCDKWKFMVDNIISNYVRKNEHQ